MQKDLILRYTEDSYEWVNEDLRKKQGVLANTYDFSQALDKALRELPNYNDITYRGVNLTAKELEKYIEAYKQDTAIVEHTFVSSSRNQRVAKDFIKHEPPKKRVLFEIAGKTGKSIAEYSKSPQEQEVLFVPNTRFSVDEIIYEDNKVLIRLFEV